MLIETAMLFNTIRYVGQYYKICWSMLIDCFKYHSNDSYLKYFNAKNYSIVAYKYLCAPYRSCALNSFKTKIIHVYIINRIVNMSVQ